MILCRPWFRWLLIGVSYGALTARAQIDPEKRRLFELGYNQPQEGRAPLAGYAFYFQNQPGFLRTNLTLRLALAPIYLDTELGVAHALGPNTDLGLGVAGGGFADSYAEIRQGQYLREESFTGHGGEVSLSLYHQFNPGRRVPLFGILRSGLHYSFYERDDHTAPAFVLPDDQYTYHVRAGLRWGGLEPSLQPPLAMELSVWYDYQYRTDPGVYGFSGDRRVRPDAHLVWGRALLAYTLTNSLQTFQISMTAGTSADADRLSAYRLGAMLPLASEFALALPGYYFQELSARRFVLWNGQYSVALDELNHWNVTGFAATALVDYLPGLEQPDPWNSGIGGGLTYRSPARTWEVTLAYAYGLDAIRSDGRGSHSISLLCQIDLEARHRYKAEEFKPPLTPNRLRGLDWLLGR